MTCPKLGDGAVGDRSRDSNPDNLESRRAHWVSAGLILLLGSPSKSPQFRSIVPQDLINARTSALRLVLDPEASRNWARPSSEILLTCELPWRGHQGDIAPRDSDVRSPTAAVSPISIR